MAPFSKSGKKKQQDGAADSVNVSTTKTPTESESFSNSHLSRQSIARITEQKIDEIESAIKQDYLKISKAAREAAASERSEDNRPAQSKPSSNVKKPDSRIDEEFQPTLVRSDSKFALFNDDLSD